MRKIVFLVFLSIALILSVSARAQEEVNLEVLTCGDLLAEVEASQADAGVLLLAILAFHRGQLNDPVIPLDDASWDMFGDQLAETCGDPSMQNYTIIHVLREMGR